MNERLSLVQRMNRGEFIQSVQLDPPKEADFDKLKNAVTDLRDIGVTVFDVNGSRRDCMDAFEVASKIADDAIELIPHVTARDANLQKILTGVSQGYNEHAIRNVLIITGDPYKVGADGQPDPRNIFQTKSVGIIASLDRQVRKSHMADGLTIAAAVNQNAENLQRETYRLRAKDREGTDFFMSQPVFDKDQAKKMHEFHTENSEKPVLAGIWPLTKLATVEHIHNGRVKGVVMPEDFYQEAILQKDDAGLKEWSFARTKKTVESIKKEKFAQGIYVVTSLYEPSEIVDFMKLLQ